MSIVREAFSIEIKEKNSTYYKFFDDDFKNAEKRAVAFVRKEIFLSALIYDKEDLVALIRWDENLEQTVCALTLYGKCKGYDSVEP